MISFVVICFYLSAFVFIGGALFNLMNQQPKPQPAPRYVPKPSPKPLPPPRQRNAGIYGDAGYAFEGEFNHAFRVKITADCREHVSDGVFLNKIVNPYAQPPHGTVMDKWWGWGDNENCIRYHYHGENNLVTLAPPGSGKGTAAIIPTLLFCHQSMFVFDPKGENFLVSCWQRLYALGHDIIALNPFNLHGREAHFDGAMTHRFSPLHHLRPDQPDFVTNIQACTAALIYMQGGEPFWIDSARILVSCLLGHICSDPWELAQGNNTLLRLFDILALSPPEFSAFMLHIYTTSRIPLARDQAGQFIDHSKAVEGIVKTVISQLGFMTEPAIRDFLSGHDFDFAELRQRPITVFFMLPPRELDTYARFSRLIVQSFFNSMMVMPRATDRPVLALLDEQAKLGSMKIIEDSAALLRGYKVRIWSIFQDLNQIKDLYPQRWETFLASAGVVQIMTPNDATTADYFSRMIGDETVWQKTTSTGTNRSYGASQGISSTTGRSGETASSSFGQNSSTSESYGYSETVNNAPQRAPFLSPQDLYGMPRNRSLLLLKGLKYPLLAQRVSYLDLAKPISRFDAAKWDSNINSRLYFLPHPAYESNAHGTFASWMQDWLDALHYTRNEGKALNGWAMTQRRLTSGG